MNTAGDTKASSAKKDLEHARHTANEARRKEAAPWKCEETLRKQFANARQMRQAAQSPRRPHRRASDISTREAALNAREMELEHLEDETRRHPLLSGKLAARYDFARSQTPAISIRSSFLSTEDYRYFQELQRRAASGGEPLNRPGERRRSISELHSNGN